MSDGNLEVRRTSEGCMPSSKTSRWDQVPGSPPRRRTRSHQNLVPSPHCPSHTATSRALGTQSNASKARVKSVNEQAQEHVAPYEEWDGEVA
ncbi:hypothetical protein Q3G72_020079 [Acer saccharum]|nr:hypothetical protein Q3G72_017216 [Acer saccharum]KAK1571610.1 hypothetical protein Q3G72_020079 [Acer saccharum]